MISINKEIADILKQLSDIQEDIWKGTAYLKASRNIENLNTPIDEIEDFTEIEGVGSDISDEIQEYLETGKIQKLEDLSKKGKKKSKYTRDEILVLTKNFITKANKKDLKYAIAGSVRRKSPKIKDLDILILLEDIDEWKELVEETADKIIKSGSEEIDFVFNGVDINLRAVPEKDWGGGLLFFTGSNSFNIYLRQIAKDKGYKLNRHGLFNGDSQIAVTEKDIFKKLELPYIAPEDR